MTTRPGALDDHAVRRSRRALSLRLAGAITAVVAFVGGLAYVVTANRQDAQTAMMLRYTLGQNRVGAVDPCNWLFVLRGEAIDGEGQAPDGLPLVSDLRSVQAGGGAVDRSVTVAGTPYAVRTQQVHGEVRQAVFDERYLQADRRHLVWALLLAELVGLIIAGYAGQRLAGVAIRPLAEALARQRQFVADAGHELRVPITRLHTRTQLLLDRARPGGPPVPDLDVQLRRVVDGSRELAEIVDELLGAAGLRAARPPGQPVDLAAVVAGVATADAERARALGVELSVELPDEPAPVNAARQGLRRMVNALLDNAVRYGRPGGRVWLTVGIRERGRIVELTVSDEGSGVAPADRDRIFDRFHRGDNAAGPGYGLGLALAREVVTAAGGTIDVTARPGGGAQFQVRLPSAARRRSRPLPAADAPAAAAPADP